MLENRRVRIGLHRIVDVVWNAGESPIQGPIASLNIIEIVNVNRATCAGASENFDIKALACRGADFQFSVAVEECHGGRVSFAYSSDLSRPNSVCRAVAA